jgi:hypothetical protein
MQPLRSMRRLAAVLRAMILGASCAWGLAPAQQTTPADTGAVQAGGAQTGAARAGVADKLQSEAGEPRAAGQTPSPAASDAPGHGVASVKRTGTEAPPPKTPGSKSPGASDRLDLGTATVTGDREQPKVMYIVPWKKSDIGDLAGKPMNSLVDEILAPVDRDVFKREVYYYRAVKSDATPSPQGEK